MLKQRFTCVGFAVGLSLTLVMTVIGGLFLNFSGCRIGYTSYIHSIRSYNEVAHIVAAADTHTLVIFDVDNTLIVPANKLFWSTIEKEHAAWIRQMYAAVFKRAKKSFDFYSDKLREKEKYMLIEPFIADSIKELQQRGVKVIALTALNTGSDGPIESLPVWRFKQLQELGIDFEKANIPDMHFPELPHQPVFYKGILCSTDLPKGVVLAAFLDRIRWKPSRVIFFDDRMTSLLSVKQALKQRNISFLGYEYKGEQFLVGELDKDIATLQLNHLVDHEEWLNEDEVG